MAIVFVARDVLSSRGMSKSQQLKDRTEAFAVAIVKLSRELPSSVESRRIGLQLIGSGTSIAANYRAACRARTRAEFIAKIGTVLEEADETAFWLDLLVKTGQTSATATDELRREANELTAIFAASLRTARSHR